MSDPLMSERSSGAPVPVAVIVGTLLAVAGGFIMQFAVISPFIQSQIRDGSDIADLSTKLMVIGPIVALLTTSLGCMIARLVAGGRISAGWITAGVLFVWSVGWSVFSFSRMAMAAGGGLEDLLVPFLAQALVAAVVCGLSGAISMALPLGNGSAE